MQKTPLSTILLSTALTTALVSAGNYGYQVHRSLQQFTQGETSIDEHLTEPVVVGPDTLLKVDTAERILIDGQVPFCSTWCFRAVFRKAHQYFQVDFQLAGTDRLRPVSTNELYEPQVKELLLKADPKKYRQWFGAPQEL